MKYSLTHGGLIAMIALPLLVHAGFSEQCSGEVWNFVSMLPGFVTAWIGRMKAKGPTSLGGFKK